MRTLTSSWRSLRDRRRLDVLDVLPERDTRSAAAADAGRSHQVRATAETATSSPSTGPEPHAEA